MSSDRDQLERAPIRDPFARIPGGHSTTHRTQTAPAFRSRAATIVTTHAHDPADAAQLLAMLGLHPGEAR